MSFSLAELKRDARQALHDMLSVDATYEDGSTAEPVPVRIRWHNKLVQTGDLEGSGYAEILAYVDRLVFDRAAVDEAGLLLVRGGRVTIADYNDAVFVLDMRDPADGPHTVIWTVTREKEAS